jgi:hypothetical protein
MQINNASIFFCDDVREEGGNKVSLMGVLGPHLTLPSLPATIHRICVILMADIHGDEPLEVEGELTSPQGVPLPPVFKTIVSRPETPSRPDTVDEEWNLRVAGTLNGVLINQPSTITVNFRLGGIELHRTLSITAGEVIPQETRSIAAGALVSEAGRDGA